MAVLPNSQLGYEGKPNIEVAYVKSYVNWGLNAKLGSSIITLISYYLFLVEPLKLFSVGRII